MIRNPVKHNIRELNNLYDNIVSISVSSGEINSNKKELTEKIDLITSGMKQDAKIVGMLKKSNEQISTELQSAKDKYGSLKVSMKEVGELVRKLEKMDAIETELSGLKRLNTAMRLKVTPLSAKIWKLQEDLFNLKKEKVTVQGEHTELMKRSREFVELRTKILPMGEILNLRDRVTSESATLEKNRNEVERIKADLADLVPVRDSLKQELEVTLERLTTIKDSISSLEGKVRKMAPRVMPEEDERNLVEEVSTLKSKREVLMAEKKEISPRIAAIAEEEEQMTAILESYQAKNKKDGDKLALLKKDLKAMDVDKDTVSKLENEVLSIEGKLKVKKKEGDKNRTEYSKLMDDNQIYKATIKEVDEGTAKLKQMMSKKKK